jgi:hypothetical protein
MQERSKVVDGSTTTYPVRLVSLSLNIPLGLNLLNLSTTSDLANEQGGSKAGNSSDKPRASYTKKWVIF